LGVLFASLQSASDSGAGAGLAAFIFGGLFVAFYALFFFATAAFIRLAMDIEANTRKTAEAIRNAPWSSSKTTHDCLTRLLRIRAKGA
jgi:hypothetical protein